MNNVERRSNSRITVRRPPFVDLIVQDGAEPPKLRLKPDRRAHLRYSTADIALRAYELFKQRGGEHGHDWDDWLRAEIQLRQMRES